MKQKITKLYRLLNREKSGCQPKIKILMENNSEMWKKHLEKLLMGKEQPYNVEVLIEQNHQVMRNKLDEVDDHSQTVLENVENQHDKLR